MSMVLFKLPDIDASLVGVDALSGLSEHVVTVLKSPPRVGTSALLKKTE
jgi:hypothetical protein